MTVDNCPANEPAKRILMLQTVLLGPFRADVIGGRYRGLRPRLLTVAPAAPCLLLTVPPAAPCLLLTVAPAAPCLLVTVAPSAPLSDG